MKKIVLGIAVILPQSGCAPASIEGDLQPSLETAIQATYARLTEETPVAPPSATPRPTEPQPSPTPTRGVGSQRRSSSDGMLQVFVPEGNFLMGSLENDPDAFPHEKPQHSVWLDAFWIDETEVTNAMYA